MTVPAGCEADLARDRARSLEVELVEQKRRGFLYNWGPQAWIDMVMSKRMIVTRAWPLVHYTFLPILRMTTDSDHRDDRRMDTL